MLINFAYFSFAFLLLLACNRKFFKRLFLGVFYQLLVTFDNWTKFITLKLSTGNSRNTASICVVNFVEFRNVVTF